LLQVRCVVYYGTFASRFGHRLEQFADAVMLLAG
jgi:hypothetical protein